MSLFKMRNPFKHIFSKKNISEEMPNDATNNIINTIETNVTKAIETTNTKEIEVKKMAIINWEDTTPFTPPITGGQVIKVYDGDTFTLAGHLPMNNSPLFRFSIRLNGIDAPEIKGKTSEEITVANEAKNALTNLILHKEIILKNIGIEKYGRILADVYLDDLHVNDWLIRERYAVKYDGKTKKIPTSWLKYRLTGEF